MYRHVVGQQFNAHKTRFAHHLHQLFRCSQAARAHGEQVKMEVGICLGRPIRTLRIGFRHGLSQKKDAANGQGIVYLVQSLLNHLIRMVMGQAHLGDQISPLR